jgi:hypothetical protein
MPLMGVAMEVKKHNTNEIVGTTQAAIRRTSLGAGIKEYFQMGVPSRDSREVRERRGVGGSETYASPLLIAT